MRALFQHYTPIFIGYGGNDDSLMNLLESLQVDDIKGQLIWCYYEGGNPSERIRNVVTDLHGVLVPVPDFDLLMVLLGEKMNIRLLDEEISERARDRTERYRDRIGRLDTLKYPSVRTALAATYDRSGGWWAWGKKASMEKDPDRVETLYRQGLEQYAESPELHCNYGMFLWKRRNNPAKAEEHLRRSAGLDRINPLAAVNLANFLWREKKDLKRAEDQFRESLKSFPNDPTAVTAYTDFLLEARSDLKEAKRHLREALEKKPVDDILVARYADCLKAEDVNEAEKVYRQALALDPQSVPKKIGLAYLLWQERKM